MSGGATPAEEALDRAEAESQTLLGQARANLFDRGVPTGVERRHRGGLVRLDPIRAPVAAKRPGAGITQRVFPFAPAADADRAHTEPIGRLAMRRTRRNGAQNSNAKIDRQRSRHVRRPPSGRQSESIPARFASPSRFIQVGVRSKPLSP